MSDESPSLREYTAAIASLTDAMNKGFAGVHARQDKANGKLDRHDVLLADLRPQVAVLDQCVRVINKELFEQGAAPAAPALPPELLQQLTALVQSASNPENRPALTVRDVTILAGAGKAFWALGGASIPFIVWLLIEWGKRGSP